MRNFNELSSSVVYSNVSQLPAKKFTCGYCGNLISSEKGYVIGALLHGSTKSTEIGCIYCCPHCKMPTFYHSIDKEFIPGEKFGAEVKSLPDTVKEIYDEARKCFSSGCYTACIMMSRKILMNFAVENGAKEGNSFAFYVEYLDNNNFIPPKGKQWVDYIRTQGNEANHEISIKQIDEAKNTLIFVEMLLKFGYEFPLLAPSKS